MTLLEELNQIEKSINHKKELKNGTILKIYYDNKGYKQWLIECTDEYDNFFWCKGFNTYQEAYKYYNEVK